MLVIEIDGATHRTDDEIESDRRRTRYLRGRGWDELRFTNIAIYDNSNNVLERIEREATRRANVAAMTARS